MNYFLLTKNFILNIIFPIKCVGCGKCGFNLCSDCAANIEVVVADVCPQCGKISSFGKYCADCRKSSNLALAGILPAAIYESGPTKEIVHSLKYLGVSEFSDVLGELIVRKLLRQKGNLPDNSVVVPVPLHSKREAERGYNQSELIGKYVAKKLNIAGGNAMSRIRNNRPQIELRREARLKNLAGCFVVEDRELIAGKTVLLIDDVATTGATLNECAKALISAGAKEVWGIVAARG